MNPLLKLAAQPPDRGKREGVPRMWAVRYPHIRPLLNASAFSGELLHKLVANAISLGTLIHPSSEIDNLPGAS
eukprot:1072419-Amphidinium_carterae.1